MTSRLNSSKICRFNIDNTFAYESSDVELKSAIISFKKLWQEFWSYGFKLQKTNFTLGWEEQIYQRVLAPKGFSLRYISCFSLLDKYLGPSLFSSETSINHVKIVFHAIYRFFLICIIYIYIKIHLTHIYNWWDVNNSR